MKKLTSYSKRVKYTYVKTTLATLFVSLFFLKGYAAFEKTGENYFHVFLNGNEIGTVGEADRAEQLLQEARRNIASQSDDMIFMDADLKLVGESNAGLSFVYWIYVLRAVTVELRWKQRTRGRSLVSADRRNAGETDDRRIEEKKICRNLCGQACL